MSTAPRHPDVCLRVEDLDARPLVLVAAVCRALRGAGVPGAEVEEFAADALSADYDHVLRTTMAWVTLSPASEAAWSRPRRRDSPRRGAGRVR